MSFESTELKESLMDTSIGSDGEWSASCISPRSPTTLSPTDSEKSLSGDLKFSIANILRPEFGHRRESPSPDVLSEGSESAFSMTEPSTTPRMEVSSGPQPNTAAESVVKVAAQAAAAAALGLAAQPVIWPAWVYCTRYSDRPSSGPRCRKMKKKPAAPVPEEKRPRTAFTSEQLNRLKDEFVGNRYLTEKRRQELAHELGLNESQIKIWFQNKRAKIKKQVGVRNPLAFHLMAQGLYNHATIPIHDDMNNGENESPPTSSSPTTPS